MLRRQLGLTKLYNPVNDPDVQGDADVDRMRCCSSQPVHGAVSPLAKAIQRLDRAQRLTDSAAELLARQACHDEVEEMLDLADTALSAADEAELLARISDLPETAVVAPGAVLDDAEAHVATATSQLRGLPPPVTKPHRQRARSIRARIQQLREALNARPDNVVVLPSQPKPPG